MSNVRPLEDRILIKPIDPETKTASGLFLPETAKERPMQGTVISTGPGLLLDNGDRAPVAVKKGDTVLFSSYSGTEVKINDETFLIMTEEDILGVIE